MSEIKFKFVKIILKILKPMKMLARTGAKEEPMATPSI